MSSLTEKITGSLGTLFNLWQSGNGLTAQQEDEAIKKAHDRSAELDKIEGLESSASKIDETISRNQKFPVSKDISSSEIEISNYGARKNIWKYTEDIHNSIYVAVSLTKEADNIEIGGIKLTKVSTTSFNGALVVAGSNVPLVAGERYLMSFYSFAGKESFFGYQRRVVATYSYGHGARLHTNEIRRHWILIEALSSDSIDNIIDPTIALGSGEASSFTWYKPDHNPREVYIGGFQLEKIEDSTYTDGIAMIGDSTMAGASDQRDLPTNLEVSRWLEAELRTNVFNRAVGGQRLDTMDARWETDITPLKVNSKYVIIQGGLNDIAQGRTLAEMQTSLNSMNTKALNDGFIPVFFTVTPFDNAHNDAEKEALRTDYNAWLKENFENVIDIASIVADPYDESRLNAYNDMNGDGVHYTQEGSRLIGLEVAKWSGWDFIKPSPYQKIEANTWNNGGGLTEGMGIELKGSFDTSTATTEQTAQRVLALETILRDSGLID
ncbi:SGNH/GDSL hydrolase family protein [Arcobacter arenosus]|uniref:SGNH/GDSL hydrolase family protein n=1 Tax=Arcobacter arenosus TaxID=2576037 RepID=A0A5R8Y4N0_9BACT|nr:SGNH/GDSL hydrolase family protein [Arcobacter arenosus]TLP41026.1 SGNH/GDSL hydrolase family protein [Arcobacter arenosus]